MSVIPTTLALLYMPTNHMFDKINQNSASVRKTTAREDIFFSRTTTLYTHRQECCACKQYNCQNQNPDLNNPWQDRLLSVISKVNLFGDILVMYGTVLMERTGQL